jgi:putative ABC transport system permease protein
MNWFGEFIRRLRFRLRGARFDQDLAEEMRLHMELRAAEAGDRTAAQRRFGNATQLRESSREAWGWTMLDTLHQDLRYGLRMLASHPGFTATAVLSLALGIGANTAIFSILDAVILRFLPVEDPQRLVQIRPGPSGDDEFTNPIWEQVRDHQQAFTGVLAYSPDRFDLADGGESHFAQGLWVSGSFFHVLGVPAIRGRVFTGGTAGEDKRGSAPLAVISYSFWQRNFAGDAHVIGKTVRLNRHAFEIVGVTPPWFRGLDVDQSFDVAIPIVCEPLLHAGHSSLDERASWWLRILGRLAAEESLQRAGDRMRAIAPEIFRATVPGEFPDEIKKEYLTHSFFLQPASTGFSEMGAQYRTALFTLMAITGLVLLIACANIANLLMSRASARQREFSVRMAIGAGRARVVRQLMTESLLLAALGAGAGLLLASWGGRLLVHLLSTTGHPLEIDLSPDPRVLAFTFAVAISTAVLFGFAPALRATRMELNMELNQLLKESARAALHGATRFNLGKALVTFQVVLSLVLLVGAGLFLQTLRNLLTADPGFTRHNILLIGADIQQTAIPAARRTAVYREIRERLQAIPGVAAAASAMFTPIGQQGWAQPVQPEGMAAKSPRETLLFLNRVSPGYFKTMRTPLLLGRDLNDRDDLHSPKVMLINESAARQFFGAVDPLGKTIALDQNDVYQIVGVVKDTRYNRINEQPRRIAYVACGQDVEPGPSMRFVVRSDIAVGTLIPAVRSAISGVNRDISLEIREFEAQVSESLLQPRIVALLSSVFGALALLLAMVGLYGITAYAVARRRAEIGVRIALGARPGSVIRLMLRDLALPLAVGISLGLGASLAAGRLVISLLYGVRPNDPAQLAAATLILAAAAALAGYLPARRAARLDPMITLREE